MAELCARALIESGNTGKTDQFWIDAETAYLSAIFAHVATLPEPTPLTALRFFTEQKPPQVLEQLHGSSSVIARAQATVFEQTDSRIQGGIVPAVAAKLQFLRDNAAARFTSASLEAPNFTKLRLEPTAIYLCLREQDLNRLKPLTSLFYTVLLEQLASVEETDQSRLIPVIAMLDEFANIGKIPNFATTITLARGRGLALWLGLQAMSQLPAIYGEDNSKTIVNNCTTKIALHGLDADTAAFVSKTLGDKTETYTKFNFTVGAGLSLGTSAQEHRRPLMTPDEITRIEENQAICRTSNKYPLILDKEYYSHQPKKAQMSCLGSAIARNFEENNKHNGNGANGAKKPMYELE
jgi:type IV secretion system protein VirD4